MFRSNNTKSAWKGLKLLSVYSPKCVMPEPDVIPTFVNELNTFFTRFEGSESFTDKCNEILASPLHKNLAE